jgi:hypothetical protein
MRQSRLKKLTVSALTICMLGSLGGWERGEDELRAALAPALAPVGSAARLYFATQCSRDNEDTFAPFPRLTLAPANAQAPSLDAVRTIFRYEREAAVEDRAGIIKITLGVVPTDLLSTRIARLTLASEARWTPSDAIDTIQNAPEVQTAMRRLNVRFPGGLRIIDIISGPTGDNRYPHLPSSLENVTMDQALDAVAKTFRDLVIYGVCTRPNGQSVFWISETPLTECPSHFQVYSCFDPPGSEHLPGPIELSPDPLHSPHEPQGYAAGDQSSGQPIHARAELDEDGATLPALLVAASTTLLSLDDGQLHIAVPTSVRVQQSKVNWETLEYDLYELSEKDSFLQIVAGGGAYNLHGYTRMCLNGRQAWKIENADSGMVVAGEPGFNAVDVYWAKLSGARLTEAQNIVSSLKIDWGAKC